MVNLSITLACNSCLLGYQVMRVSIILTLTLVSS